MKCILVSVKLVSISCINEGRKLEFSFPILEQFDL